MIKSSSQNFFFKTERGYNN